MTISKDQFVQLVKNSIILQNKDNYSYITIEQERCVCPFCEKDMSTNKQPDGGWILSCDCEKAIKIHNMLKELYESKKTIEEQIISVNSIINNNALRIIQQHYQNKVLPARIKNLELENDEIQLIAEI